MVWRRAFGQSTTTLLQAAILDLFLLYRDSL